MSYLSIARQVACYNITGHMKTLTSTVSLLSIVLVLSACGKKEVEEPVTPPAVEPTASESVVADATAEAEAVVEAAQEEVEAIVEEAKAEVEATIAEVQEEATAKVEAVVEEAQAELTDAVADKATDQATESAAESLKSALPKF